LLGGISIGVPGNIERTRAGISQEFVLAVDFNASLEADQVHIQIHFGFGSGQAGFHFGIQTVVPQESQLNGGHLTGAEEEFTVEDELGLTGPFDFVGGGHRRHISSVLEAVADPLSY
jgi:hypothetical protein